MDSRSLRRSSQLINAFPFVRELFGSCLHPWPRSRQWYVQLLTLLLVIQAFTLVLRC